jgi:hypothetical protein
LAINALGALSAFGPKLELVGPTVDDDIRRAITRYGKDAVKEAVKRQTTSKRGRKPEKDWPELREQIDADARDWLQGGDPFATRSNYSMAKDFADRNPGHSYPATMQRIERKLAKSRAWVTFATAMNLSRDDYPHAAHIRALEALSQTDVHPVWADLLENAKSELADYEARNGEPPPAHLSMKDIKDASLNALNSPLKPNSLGGLLGAAIMRSDSGTNT